MVPMMLCEFCDGLSINHLIELAEAEFSGRVFPQQAYYQHHASYGDLAHSAKDGCALCKLICHGFETVVLKEWAWEGQTRAQAVREIENSGESPDIKICINADHLYSSGKLDQVELFDVLLVQAGTSERVHDDDSEMDTFIPPLPLTLSVPRGEIKVQKYRVGRYHVDPVLGSQSNYDVAKSWLEECCAFHDSCPKKQASELPTRVIDVGTLDGQQDPRLICSKAAQGNYIALSHCWGGLISPLLETSTLDRFQARIPLSDLPANFRDAISITRQLGIQYLWIDSLCIIQDSAVDWEVESKNMGAIYRNALVTISAAASRQSTDGILKPSLDSKAPGEGKAVALEILTNGSSNGIVNLSLKNEEEETLRTLFLKSPLSRRGWTLQESILSCRVLYYGGRQVYWKCPRGFQSADGMPAGTLMPEDQSYPELSNALHSHFLSQSPAIKPDTNLILEDYYILVQEYASRKLSFNSDKFPAFSALAQFFHTILGGEYLAGIWSTDFRRGLTWYRESRECRHVLADQAPSWSWAVTNDPVTFYTFDRKEIASPHDAQLLDYKVELRGHNPYGQIDSGHLVLEGLTKKLCRSRQVINMYNPEFTVGNVDFDEAESEEAIRATYRLFKVTSESEDYFLSVVSGDGPRKEWDIDFSLISEDDYIALVVDVTADDSGTEMHQRVVALVLRRLPNIKGDVYRRAGTLLTLYRTASNFETWIQNWERRVVKII